MGMNRSRRDVWPPYEPTRHVLIKRHDHRHARPWQGFVVDWRRDQRQWAALVVFRDETLDGMPIVQQWMPADRLIPCSPDPNPPKDWSF
jgi:hypothetical protein